MPPAWGPTAAIAVATVPSWLTPLANRALRTSFQPRRVSILLASLAGEWKRSCWLTLATPKPRADFRRRVIGADDVGHDRSVASAGNNGGSPFLHRLSRKRCGGQP